MKNHSSHVWTWIIALAVGCPYMLSGILTAKPGWSIFFALTGVGSALTALLLLLKWRHAPKLLIPLMLSVSAMALIDWLWISQGALDVILLAAPLVAVAGYPTLRKEFESSLDSAPDAPSSKQSPNLTKSTLSLINPKLIKPLPDNLQQPTCVGCGEAKPQVFLFGPLWYVALGLRNRLMPMAIKKFEMQTVCRECLIVNHETPSAHQIKVSKKALHAPDASTPLTRHEKQALAEQLARTPPYAFFNQECDWPVCCGSCTQYGGYPETVEEACALPSTHTYWSEGLSHPPPAHLNETEDPSTDINVFKCLLCSKRYFTWQIS